MVAFGQMVQLLLEYPEQLSDFVGTTVAQRPTIGALDLSTIRAFTDREQTLLAQRDQDWLSALSDVSPQHVETLRQKMETRLQEP